MGGSVPRGAGPAPRAPPLGRFEQKDPGAPVRRRGSVDRPEWYPWSLEFVKVTSIGDLRCVAVRAVARGSRDFGPSSPVQCRRGSRRPASCSRGPVPERHRVRPPGPSASVILLATGARTRPKGSRASRSSNRPRGADRTAVADGPVDIDALAVSSRPRRATSAALAPGKSAGLRLPTVRIAVRLSSSGTSGEGLGSRARRATPRASASPSSRRRTRPSDPRSANATNTVSSPAIEPTTSGQRARSSAAASGCADPGSVFITSIVPASRISTGMSRSSRPHPLLAGGVGLAEAGRDRVGLHAVAGRLDQAQLGDVAADRRLGRAEAALAEGGGELLLGADRALLHEVADRALAELLHDLHGIAVPTGPGTRRGRPRRARAGTRRRSSNELRPQVAQQHGDRQDPGRRTTPTIPDDQHARRPRRRPRRGRS